MTICCITTSSEDAISTSIIQIENKSTQLTPCTSSHNLVEITKTPEKSGEIEEFWKCCWITCSEQRTNVDALYDHVIEEHIRPILDEKMKDENENDEIIGCQWEDCDMEIERGTIRKKIEWLEQHFRTRHSKGARTYKCVIEGCEERAATSRQLEEHVRACHFESPRKQRPLRRSESTSSITQVKTSAFVLTEMAYHNTDRKRTPLWTDVESNKMIARNVLHYYEGYNVKYEKVDNLKLVGAAKRKTSYVKNWRTHYKITPVEKEWDTEKEEDSNAPKFSNEVESKMTLGDLFPNLYENEPVNQNNNEEIKELVIETSANNEEDDFPPPPAISPSPEYSGMYSDIEDEEIMNEMPLLKRCDSPEIINEDIIRIPILKKRKSVEIIEEPLKKRQRRSLPYGVFEEDQSDNEDDYGYERIPEEILKQPPNIYTKLNVTDNCKYSTGLQPFFRIVH